MTEPTSGTRTKVLSDEMLRLMDRAVRAARDEDYCDQFSKIAAGVFGVPANEVVDSDGWDCENYNIHGVDKEGRNREGRDKDGFDRSGYDEDGYDTEGFDCYGLNREGLDKEGRDQYRFDRNGFDREGYNANGRRSNSNREWYAAQASKPDEDFCYNARHDIQPKPKTDRPVRKFLGF